MILPRIGLRLAILLIYMTGVATSQPLVQVHADFSADPGWESLNNRVVARDPPLVKQDFGWSSRATHFPSEPGEIGGHIWSSTTPAWYGTTINPPLTFNDHFSAFGKFVMPANQKSGDAYLGFFNHSRQEWRPWNSMAMRLSYGDHFARIGFDYMSALWGASGFETDIALPAGDQSHTWRMTYDPDERVPEELPDAKLQSYLTPARQTAQQILEKAKFVEPNVTQAEIDNRLSTALSQGLICFLHRQQDFWTSYPEIKGGKGVMKLQIDDRPPYKIYIIADHRQQPLSMDRFGIFNLQLYHRPFEFYISDLLINDKKVDLSRDPQWESNGNRAEFKETDFQRQDFGYSDTNFAGNAKGEIGGTFYRVEPIDPMHGYYADDVGTLTLDDPISFSGNICFTRGATDAGMFFGFFNAKGQSIDLDEHGPKRKLHGLLGINIEGPTSVGYYFSPVCSTPIATKRASGPVFLPTGQRHKFTFNYDPHANHDKGQITVTLDEKPFTLDLKSGLKTSGETLDHFGLLTVRTGGKYVTVFLDDVTYTARRSADFKPVFHPQHQTLVDYPAGGRKY